MPDYPSSTDDQLVEFARAGDAAAYGELFSRHSGIGTAIARRYYQIADADDLVSESFARILSTLQRGGGPRSGFRPYLITTIGNVARRWATQTREGASDELDLIEDPKTVDDPVVASADREFALEAFRSLPDRWQAVLWYSAVEGMGPTDVAGYLGMTPNAAAVLAHRARAGLRTAWVQAHLNDSTLSDECRWTSGRLGKRATGSLSSREQDRVRLHLSSCLACRSRARELDQLSAKLAVLLIPALLGIGLTSLEPDGAAMAAAALPASPVSGTLVPAVSTTHLWLAALAVVVATATALATSSALPAVGETRQLAPVAAPVAAPDFSDRGLETKAQPSEPSHGAEPTAETAQSPETVAPPVAMAPDAPTVLSTFDPDAVRPPTLAGSAAPHALVVITDELGFEVARTTAGETGAWSTPELSTLSPAAASILIRQFDEAGLASPATTVGPLAPRPLITGPADGYLSYGVAPFDITLDGWPGATVQATFEAIEYWGYLHPETYPAAQVVIDSAGHGVLHIDASEFGFHRVTLRYVDGIRSSQAYADLSFGLFNYPD